MSAMKNLSRYDVLLSQFPTRESQKSDKDYESLMRIFHFLYDHTDLYYLFFIREEMLLQYLIYHCSHQFKIVPFCQVVQDIKTFLFYIKNSKEINKELHLDLSVKNIHMWLSI